MGISWFVLYLAAMVSVFFLLENNLNVLSNFITAPIHFINLEYTAISDRDISDRETNAVLKKGFVDDYIKHYSEIPFKKSLPQLPSDIELCPGTSHSLLSNALFDEAFKNNSVLMFGDSTIRYWFELLSALNNRGADEISDIFSAVDFKKRYRTNTGGHYEHKNISTRNGDTIGYFGYYWASHSPNATMNRIYHLMENYDVLVWNVGLHLLYDGKGFQNVNFLSQYKSFIRDISWHMIKIGKPVVFVTTNPICKEKYDGLTAQMGLQLEKRDPVFMKEMTKKSNNLFDLDSELPYLSYLNNDGSTTLNTWLREVVAEFITSPFVWIFDRFSIANPTKCQWTSIQDARHYEALGFVTTTAFLNVMKLLKFGIC